MRTNSWVWASTPGVARIRTFGREPVLRVEGGEALELVEAVDDDATDAGLPRRLQLGHGLVVAVEDEPVGRHAGGEGDVELAAGGHVEVHPLLVGEARHRQAEERLGGVGDPVTERGHRLAAAGPEVGLVVDEQGRAEALGQLEHVAPADAEPSVVADGRRVGQQLARQRAGHGATSPRARTPRAGRGRWPGRSGRPRPATGGPG